MINDLIKKLRKAADVLEDLLDSLPSSNEKAAKSIRSKIKGSLIIPSPYPGPNDKEMIRQARKGKMPKGVIVRKKKHWASTPAGKRKLRKIQKAVWAKKKGQQ